MTEIKILVLVSNSSQPDQSQQ